MGIVREGGSMCRPLTVVMGPGVTWAGVTRPAVHLLLKATTILKSRYINGRI